MRMPRRLMGTTFAVLVLLSRLVVVEAAPPVDIYQKRVEVDNHFDEMMREKSRQGKLTTSDIREIEAANEAYAKGHEELRTKEVETMVTDSQPLGETVGESGKGISDPNFRQVKGDRDIAVTDPRSFVKQARSRGYNITPGIGYDRIDELDILVWQKQEKPFSLGDSMIRLHDKEVAKNKTVTNQFKKAFDALETDPGTLKTRAEREKWIQEIAKAGEKAETITHSKVGKDTVTELANGKRPVSRLWDPDAPDSEQLKAMREFKEDVENRLGESYRKKSVESEDYYKTQETKIAEAKKGNDANAVKKIEAELAEARRIDAETESLLWKKNPEKMYELTKGKKLDEVIDFETGQRHFVDRKSGEKVTVDQVLDERQAAIDRARSRQKLPGTAPETGRGSVLDFLGKSKGEKAGNVVDFVMTGYDYYQNWNKEVEDARREGRPPSYGKVALDTGLNFLGFTQGYEAGENLRQTTEEDLVKYIRQQQEEMREAGLDPECLSAKLKIGAKAWIRGTLTGGYEGAKGLPILGGALTGLEHIEELKWSVANCAWEYAKTIKTIDANNETQQATLDRALRRLRIDADALVRNRQQLLVQLEPLHPLGVSVKGLIGEIGDPVALKNRINDERAAYERLFAEAMAGKNPGAGPVPAGSGDRRPLHQRLAAFLEGLEVRNEKIERHIGMCRTSAPPPAGTVKALVISPNQAALPELEADLAEMERMLLGTDDPLRGELAKRRAAIETLQNLAITAGSNVQALERAAQAAQSRVAEYNQARDALLRGAQYFEGKASDAEYRQIIVPAREKVEAARLESGPYDDLVKLSQTLRETAGKLVGINLGPLPELPGGAPQPSSGPGSANALAPSIAKARSDLEKLKANLAELIALVGKAPAPPERKPQDQARPPEKPPSGPKTPGKKGGIDLSSPNVSSGNSR